MQTILNVQIYHHAFLVSWEMTTLWKRVQKIGSRRTRSKRALEKLRGQLVSTSFQKYSNLQQYNDKEVGPTLEAIPKRIKYYQNKVDMLKLGSTHLYVAIIFFQKLHQNWKIYLLFECDNDFYEKIREDMTNGPSIDFMLKAVVDQNHIRNSSIAWKTFVGRNANCYIRFQFLKRCLQDCTQDRSNS